VQDYVKLTSDANLKVKLSTVVLNFKQKLKEHCYHGEYFARSGSSDNQFCDKFGWFRCEGSFDQNTCLRSHIINPYANRDLRIIFSTWNLDHQ